ncbi:MAG: alpha/beta fold hydrolase [Gemmataceae bacterium]
MVSRDLYPFTSQYLDLEGLRYHYVDEGAGDPLVCVHGNPTWSFYYRDLIRALRGSHRVVAMDHIGCGLSDKPDDALYPYRLARRVDDLGRLIDHLGLGDNITLVLHDWGGMIGMAWAVRNPTRVRRLVLFNTAAFGLPTGKTLPWQIAVVRNTPLGAILVQGFNAFVHGMLHTCTFRPLTPAVRAGYLAPYRTWSDRRAILRFVQDIPLAPQDPSFALVQEVAAGLTQFRNRPVFIGWGRRDFVFDDTFLAGWQVRLPQAEVHALTDASHLVLDDAGDRLFPLLEAFLRRNPVSRS